MALLCAAAALLAVMVYETTTTVVPETELEEFINRTVTFIDAGQGHRGQVAKRDNMSLKGLSVFPPTV